MEENKYKDILKGIVKIIRNAERSDIGFASICSYIGDHCPELENKDEEIRKKLIEYFKGLMGGWFPYSNEEIIAYLEKVKDFDEQLEQAYKNSDEVQYKRGYGKGYVDGMAAEKKKELEKQAAIKDGNSIDPHFGKHIITDCGAKEKIQEKIIELSHKEDQVWSEEDEKNLQGVIDEIQANKSSAPEYDLKTYDKFLSWLKSIKDRVQPQPKQVGWSEEDQDFFGMLEGYLEFDYDLSMNDKANTLDWLKSVKYRIQPQPKQDSRWKWEEDDEKFFKENILIGLGNIDSVSPELYSKIIDWINLIKKRLS